MRIWAGKKAKVERFYRQYGAALVLFASGITGERSRGQDAVHQVFLKLLEQESLGDIDDPKAFLYASVRNAALNALKSRQRDTVLEEDSAWLEPPDRDFAAELNLRRALMTLPADQREVVILHIWGELTFAQIANVLEISANTGASRYRYALERIRKIMSVEENSCEAPR